MVMTNNVIWKFSHQLSSISAPQLGQKFVFAGLPNALKDGSLQAEQKDKKALTDAFVEARDKADSRLTELLVLQNQLNSLQKLYSKVPEEIRQEIEAKKRSKEVER